MSLKIIKAGLQTTLQGAPFVGHRHIGMPAAGAADCLSFALANRLVGKATNEVALEITLSAAEFEALDESVIALTGAADTFEINGQNRPLHHSIAVKAGDIISIGAAITGCRSYLAISPKLECDILLGSGSTYIGAALGGHHGRALKNGDIIGYKSQSDIVRDGAETPTTLRPAMSNNFILRATIGPEYSTIDGGGEILFATRWRIGNRADRMGMALDGPKLNTDIATEMNSSPVFPGTIQCPANGTPILLGPDAQTTGGYPRLAQIIRADRHLIGQLKPGSEVQLVRVSPKRATEIYQEKRKLLQDWLGPITLW
ncbi:Allophanate hydrolase 2 subunit 2 [hydrothermal vent metagenome]|uniref:Allophanate hydrolase 2 subunit 2 n=1 Tax=hydrothermal vent metagenome TaxID=652676 RepID=A0A3B0S362_9ZZZZ